MRPGHWLAALVAFATLDAVAALRLFALIRSLSSCQVANVSRIVGIAWVHVAA
jgi:hypothetical protein